MYHLVTLVASHITSFSQSGSFQYFSGETRWSAIPTASNVVHKQFCIRCVSKVAKFAQFLEIIFCRNNLFMTYPLCLCLRAVWPDFFQYLSIYKKNYNLHKRIISNEVGLKVGQINAYNCQKVLFFPNLVTLLRGRYIRTKRTFSTWNITKSWRKHIVVNLASLYLVYLRLFKNEWNRKFHHQIMLRLREAFSLGV